MSVIRSAGQLGVMVPPRECLHSHVADGHDVRLAVRFLGFSNLRGRINVLRLEIPRDLRPRFACADKVRVQLEKQIKETKGREGSPRCARC